MQPTPQLDFIEKQGSSRNIGEGELVSEFCELNDELKFSLSDSRCKKRAIRKRLKGQEGKGGKLPVDLVKLARNAISPVLGKGLAELEVAFMNP